MAADMEAIFVGHALFAGLRGVEERLVAFLKEDPLGKQVSLETGRTFLHYALTELSKQVAGRPPETWVINATVLHSANDLSTLKRDFWVDIPDPRKFNWFHPLAFRIHDPGE